MSAVPAGVGVQALLARGERVEQREARLPRHLLVVPLQQEQHRDGDAGRRRGQGFVARQAEHGGGDPRFRRGERHAGGAAHRHAPEAHRAVQAGLGLQPVQGGPPLGDSRSACSAL